MFTFLSLPFSLVNDNLLVLTGWSTVLKSRTLPAAALNSCFRLDLSSLQTLLNYVFFSSLLVIFSQLLFFSISTDIKIALLPYFSLEIPTKIFGHAEVRGVITVWIHLISLNSERLTAVFGRPVLLHNPPRFVFFLWWNRNHTSDGDETKTNSTCIIQRPRA